MVTSNLPAWQLILEAARTLTKLGRSPFTLDSLIREVQKLDSSRKRESLQPVVQGMTVNASGGPPSPCGLVLRRVAHGTYELLRDKENLIRPSNSEAPEAIETNGISDPTSHLQLLHRQHSITGAVAAIFAARDRVIEVYGALFAPENLDQLTAEAFKSFLLFDNNQHWWGIHRQQATITSDMDRLREAIRILLEESQPIAARLNLLVRSDRPNYVPGLGKAVLTPILLVVYPERYGVWNTISESAMKKLGIWPSFDRGSSFGDRYERLNRTLLRIAEDVGVDLWTLDGLWWAVEQPARPATFFPDPVMTDVIEGYTDLPGTTDVAPSALFSLERHLHDFLRDNWERTELGFEWHLLEEGGDLVGYEYPTGVGRIDLLAKHRSEPRWLVVELKRDRSTDSAVGQIARYVGWVRRNLATEDETVEGMVIAHQADDQIKYALDVVPDISLRTYKIEFHLEDAGF